MDAYTMQISGERSYIAGNHDLLEFKDIRRYCSNTLINSYSALATPNDHCDNDHRYRQTVEQLCKKLIKKSIRSH